MISKKNTGAVQIEYLVVTLTLMAAMWWAIVGSSGYWGTNDPDHTDDSFTPSKTDRDLRSAPSLINALNDKQTKFAKNVYQP